MTELFTSIFATNPPSWADIQTPMNMMLRDKRRMVMDKARGEAHQLHLADPDAAPGANQSNQPGTQRWGMPTLEHYRRCLLAGLQKGETKQEFEEHLVDTARAY